MTSTPTPRSDLPDGTEDAPRRVELSVARVDPWTVMKTSFLLSVAVGIATVVVTLVLWLLLDSMHVFSDVEEFLIELGADSLVSLLDYVRLPRTLAMATIVAIINVVFLTAIATLGSFIYNLVASLVGGVRVTLMDE